MDQPAPPILTDPRADRARAILTKRGAVKPVKRGLFAVKSQTGVGVYRVEQKDESWTCTCPDAISRGLDDVQRKPCKHVLATHYYLQAETPEGKTERIPLTTPQASRAYSEALQAEIRLLDALLRDLLESVPEPEQHLGRPRTPLRDELFCTIQKVGSQLSGRRAASLFEFAEEREQITHAPGFAVTSRVLNRPTTTPILHDLIARTALPLVGLETDFTVDSSGFRTTSFSPYCSEKHGQKRRHTWLKAHICSGAKIHVVAGVVVTDGDGADSPQFKPLIEKLPQVGFQVREISADKAYSSRVNVDTADALGATPYIPFKSNATGTARGSVMWKKAYHYFQMNREEFDQHYHKRSNVESTFSAIKRKFGDVLKSRNSIARENELLCKLIAYNISVLIRTMHENGVNPQFLASPAQKEAPS